MHLSLTDGGHLEARGEESERKREGGRDVIFFNFIIGIIGSFQVFTGGFIITKGGPVDATMFYVLHLYFKAFESLRMGYGSALGVVLFAIIMALTYLSFRASNRLVYYEGRLR